MPTEEMGSRALPQPPGINNRAVLIFVFGFLLFVAASIAGLLLFLKTQAPAAFVAQAERRFAPPELQKLPQNDLAQFEARQRAALTTYAWVDRDHGIVRIPIDEAMRLLAGRGPHAYDALQAPPASPPAGDGGKP